MSKGLLALGGPVTRFTVGECTSVIVTAQDCSAHTHATLSAAKHSTEQFRSAFKYLFEETNSYPRPRFQVFGRQQVVQLFLKMLKLPIKQTPRGIHLPNLLEQSQSCMQHEVESRCSALAIVQRSPWCPHHPWPTLSSPAFQLPGPAPFPSPSHARVDTCSDIKYEGGKQTSLAQSKKKSLAG